MDPNTSHVIELLMPKTEAMVMDLVEVAGVDILPWSINNNGSLVKTPRANPKYVYEWSFGGGDDPTVFCVWHGSLAVKNEWILYEDNLREFALKLDLIAIDRYKPADVRSRARSQAKRARNFDSLLQKAYRKSQAVRVILLKGNINDELEIAIKASKVDYRLLDSENWFIHNYTDENGRFLMVRSAPKDVEDIYEDVVSSNRYEDQFSKAENPQKVNSIYSSFIRSAEKRNIVLSRSAGICEYCGTKGFITSSQSVYLETHHVVSLANNGPDIEWNMVALCPNDHRKAHFSQEREAIRNTLIAKLKSIYPKASFQLDLLNSNIN